MAQKRFLALNAMDKLMREASSLRVSESAKETLANVLEEKATEIARKAAILAEHAGRRTLTGKDIALAMK
ncbi:NFYB/HAP3 family transcription factor subunit [Candidatus Woesearchaeota archaeon]|nr:NFYB/HAP3 family transcription factor subunit [Candidatus Woesearchaeota archaeon]